MMIQSVGFALGTTKTKKKTGEFSFLLFFPMQNEGLLPARLKEGSVVHGFAGAAATHAQVRGETNDEQVSRHDRQSGRKQVRRGRRRVSNVKQKGS